MKLCNTDIEMIAKLRESLVPTSIPEGVLVALETVLLQIPDRVHFSYGFTTENPWELVNSLFNWSEFNLIYGKLARGEEIEGIKLNYRPKVQNVTATDWARWTREIPAGRA